MAYWTEKEVSAYTKFSIPKLRADRSISTGIPFHKIGRMVRYKEADVKEYMERFCIPTNQSVNHSTTIKIKRRKR